ncbi:MAG: hypothetical protein HN467_15425, partial [Opitutae bacterium]|nr:hypothetical protein [Opitutae bacterium]
MSKLVGWRILCSEQVDAEYIGVLGELFLEDLEASPGHWANLEIRWGGVQGNAGYHHQDAGLSGSMDHDVSGFGMGSHLQCELEDGVHATNEILLGLRDRMIGLYAAALGEFPEAGIVPVEQEGDLELATGVWQIVEHHVSGGERRMPSAGFLTDEDDVSIIQEL